MPFVNVNLSSIAFLTVGPLLLLAFVLYMHVLVERLQRFEGLDADQRLPYLFNLTDPMSRFATWVVWYWMAPCLLALFTWKAGPRPEAPGLGCITTLTTMALLWLQIRRRPSISRLWNLPYGLALVVLAVMFILIAGGVVSFHRPLHLYQASLARIDLSGFDLRQANPSRANLQGSFLSKANLHDASLQEADLTDAILQGASLSGAQLSWARGLRGADLRGVALVGANLSWTDLREVDLDGANLTGATLYQTDLRGAHLESAIGLTQAQLDSAITDAETRLPSSLLDMQPAMVVSTHP